MRGCISGTPTRCIALVKRARLSESSEMSKSASHTNSKRRATSGAIVRFQYAAFIPPTNETSEVSVQLGSATLDPLPHCSWLPVIAPPS